MEKDEDDKIDAGREVQEEVFVATIELVVVDEDAGDGRSTRMAFLGRKVECR